MKTGLFGFFALIGATAFYAAGASASDNSLEQDATVVIHQYYSAGEIFYCGNVDSKEPGPFIVTVTGSTVQNASNSSFSTLTDSENRFCGIFGAVSAGTQQRQILKGTAKSMSKP